MEDYKSSYQDKITETFGSFNSKTRNGVSVKDLSQFFGGNIDEISHSGHKNPGDRMDA